MEISCKEFRDFVESKKFENEFFLEGQDVNKEECILLRNYLTAFLEATREYERRTKELTDSIKAKNKAITNIRVINCDEFYFRDKTFGLGFCLKKDAMKNKYMWHGGVLLSCRFPILSGFLLDISRNKVIRNSQAELHEMSIIAEELLKDYLEVVRFSISEKFFISTRSNFNYFGLSVKNLSNCFKNGELVGSPGELFEIYDLTHSDEKVVAQEMAKGNVFIDSQNDAIGYGPTEYLREYYSNSGHESQAYEVTKEEKELLLDRVYIKTNSKIAQ
jgi:hypothetical protein